MIKNKWQLGILAVVAALVIAVFLRDAVEMTIVRPVAYILWWLGIIYRFIPQPALWFLVVLAMLYLTLESIAGKFEMPFQKKEERRVTLGPVAELASQIERKSTGIYFKWQIARTLGDIAVDLQSLHQPERRRGHRRRPVLVSNGRGPADAPSSRAGRRVLRATGGSRSGSAGSPARASRGVDRTWACRSSSSRTGSSATGRT